MLFAIPESSWCRMMLHLISLATRFRNHCPDSYFDNELLKESRVPDHDRKYTPYKATAKRPEEQTQTKRAERVVGEEGMARDMAAAVDRHIREEKLAHNLLMVERNILLVHFNHATRSLCPRT